MNNLDRDSIIDRNVPANKRKHVNDEPSSQKRLCTIADLSKQEFKRLNANQQTARLCRNATLLVSQVAVAREHRLLPELLGYSLSEDRKDAFHRSVARFFHQYTRSCSKLRPTELNHLLGSDISKLRQHLEEGVFKIWLKHAGVVEPRASFRLTALTSWFKRAWCCRMQAEGHSVLTKARFEYTLTVFVAHQRQGISGLLSAHPEDFKKHAMDLIKNYSTELQAYLIERDSLDKPERDWKKMYQSHLVFPSNQVGDACLQLGVCWAVSARVHSFWTRRPDATIDDLYSYLRYDAESDADPSIDPTWIITSNDRFHQAIWEISAALSQAGLQDQGVTALIPNVVLRRLRLDRKVLVPLRPVTSTDLTGFQSSFVVKQLKKKLLKDTSEATSSFLLRLQFMNGSGHALQMRIDDRLDHHSFFDANTGEWANFGGRKEFFFAFRGYLEAHYPSTIAAYLERLPERTSY